MSGSPADLLAIAERAARAAGELLRERFEAGGEVQAASKSTPTDPVSEADRAAERAIRSVLGHARPDDAILGEEGGETQHGAGLRWIVDPLDGTVNFLYGVPQWCVSVAVHDDDGGVAGVVYDPLREELFAGCRDAGPPTLNGSAVRGSSQGELARALIGTGFAYDPAVRTVQGEIVGRLVGQVRDVRRMGSAALDMAWTAAGRYDAFYERGVQLWDIAAGSLLCAAAGLSVRPLAAAGTMPGGVIAAPAGLLDELAAIVE